MANRKLIVEIIGDSRSLERSFARSTASANKFRVGMGTIVKSAAGFLAVQKGASLAGDAIRAGIDEFTEAARVTAQTNAALKSTGLVANVTARHVEKLSGSLSQMSGIDDELIQQGENLILTFKNVRNEVGKGNQIFDRATRAAVDLSVAGFGSIETTAKQLGKALNDPIRGMTALGRAGVTFTEAQRKQIRALVDSGRALEAQKLILAEVESQVGGSARAFGETLPGKLRILRNTFDELAGSVVQRFEPGIKKAVDGVVDWLSKTRNQERVQKAINDTVTTAATIVRAFVEVLRALRDILEPVIRGVGGLANAVKLLIAVMVAAKVASFATAITGVGTAAAGSVPKVAALRAVLARLALISAIAIPITVFLNRKQITEEFNKLTDKLPKFAQGGGTIRIDQKSLADLESLRKKLQGMGGDSKEAIALIDQQIKKLTQAQRARGGAAFGPEEGDLRGRRRPTSSAGGNRNPIVVETHVNLDGKEVGRSSKRFDQNDKRRNPRQKRGPNTAPR